MAAKHDGVPPVMVNACSGKVGLNDSLPMPPTQSDVHTQIKRAHTDRNAQHVLALWTLIEPP